MDVIEPDARNPKGPRPTRERPVVVDTVVVMDEAGNEQVVKLKRPVGYRRKLSEVASRALVHERRAKAYGYMIGGYTQLQIGLHLHADPNVNTQGIAVPGGYGWQNYRDGKPPLLGDALRQSVGRDLNQGLEQAARFEARNRDQWLTILNGRLEFATAAMWKHVARGDTLAIERLVKVIERQAKMNGVDAPDRVEQTIDAHVTVEGAQPNYTDPDFQAEFFHSFAQMGAPLKLPPAPAQEDVVDAEVVEQAQPEPAHVDRD